MVRFVLIISRGQKSHPYLPLIDKVIKSLIRKLNLLNEELAIGFIQNLKVHPRSALGNLVHD